MHADVYVLAILQMDLHANQQRRLYAVTRPLKITVKSHPIISKRKVTLHRRPAYTTNEDAHDWNVFQYSSV